MIQYTMNTNEEIIAQSIKYFNQHKKEFLEQYTNSIEAIEDKTAIFTAGMSGVGKTELAIFFTEQNSNLLHIDTDNIREFFRPVGYNGQNSPLFQKAASRGFSELFSYALKKEYSLIMDSNFANIEVAIQNIERLLKKEYFIKVIYLYDYPEKCFEYATRRELITHRKVPEEVFIRSNINSYKTVMKMKEIFQDKVILDFSDLRHNEVYENISTNFLREKIGDSFDIQ